MKRADDLVNQVAQIMYGAGMYDAVSSKQALRAFAVCCFICLLFPIINHESGGARRNSPPTHISLKMYVPPSVESCSTTTGLHQCTGLGGRSGLWRSSLLRHQPKPPCRLGGRSPSGPHAPECIDSNMNLSTYDGPRSTRFPTQQLQARPRAACSGRTRGRPWGFP